MRMLLKWSCSGEVVQWLSDWWSRRSEEGCRKAGNLETGPLSVKRGEKARRRGRDERF